MGFKTPTPKVKHVIETFRFIAFNPSPLDNVGEIPVMDVRRDTPEGIERPFLRTRAYTQEVALHDAFRGYNLVHDTLGRYSAYEDVENPEDNEETQQHYYVGSKRFPAYELRNNAGSLYANASLADLKEVFRRYRNTTGNNGALLRGRIVDVRALRADLRERANAESVGLVFHNVESDTAIVRLAVDGQDMDDNHEVQGVDVRSERILVLKFDIQHGGEMLRMAVDESGTVKFTRYPGDQPGLEMLHQLEQYIRERSEPANINVR